MSRLSDFVVAGLFGLVAAGTSPAAMAGASFDAFLEGVDDGCRASPAFVTFEQGLVARFTPPKRGDAAIPTPAELAAAIGGATAVDKGEWVEVSVPVEGTWRGLALRRLVFSLGKENGIHAWAVQFAAPASEVTATFAERVAASKARMAKDYAEIEATTDLDFADRTVLYCDLSN